MTDELAKLMVVVSADTRAAESGLSRVDSSFDSSTKKASAWSGALKTAVNSGGLAIAGYAAKSVSAFASFEQAMANTQSVTKASEAQMKAWGDAVVRIGRNSRAGVQATAEAFYDVSSAVQDVDARIPALQAAINLAEAGQADLRVTTDGLTSAINAYGTEVLSAARASDVYARTVAMGKGTMDQFVSAISPMAGLASSAGVSFEELGSAIAFSTSKGNTASLAATQIKAAITSLLKPSTELQQVYRELGIESGDAALEQFGLVGVLNMVSDAVGGSTGEMASLLGSTEALQAAVVLTGDEYQAFADTFNQGIDNSTLDAQAAQLDTLAGKWDLLKSKVEAVTIGTGGALEPILSRSLDGANAALNIVDVIINPPDASQAPTQEQILDILPDAFKNVQAAVPATITFEVPSGGTLWQISADTGIPVETLLSATGAANATQVQPGQYTLSYDALGNIDVNLDSQFVVGTTQAVSEMNTVLDGSVAAFEALDRAVQTTNENQGLLQDGLSATEMVALLASASIKEFTGIEYSPATFITAIESVGDALGGVADSAVDAFFKVTDFIGLTSAPNIVTEDGMPLEGGFGQGGALPSQLMQPQALPMQGPAMGFSAADRNAAIFGGAAMPMPPILPQIFQGGMGGIGGGAQVMTLETDPSPEVLADDLTNAVEAKRTTPIETAPMITAVGQQLTDEIEKVRQTETTLIFTRVFRDVFEGAAGAIPGFAEGGDFIISGGEGGGDRAPVMFMGEPGERVHIEPVGGGGGGMGGSLTINGGLHLHGIQDANALFDQLKQVARMR